MSKAKNLVFTEAINCAKNPIFCFEMVAVVLCWNSVAVDSYFIYSVIEVDFCKLLKKIMCSMHLQILKLPHPTASVDPEGGQGVRTPPWKITSYMGFYRE